MYAIINISGKQYKAAKDQNLRVPKIDQDPGSTLKIDQVLLVDDGNSIHIGKPNLTNVSVTASIVNHGREQKILVYKKKRRKGYQRKNGHRQEFTDIKIDDINLLSSKKKESKKVDPDPVLIQEEE
ncbi:MAG: 50S ribosomal protein L21 [Candidatus Marinimicrobia bacterium]|nr:50S ribosomal protein L21 [Candidatus Neomarinimicrobiota bacterium]